MFRYRTRKYNRAVGPIPAYRASTQAVASNVTSLAVAYPTLSANDILLLFVNSCGNASTITATGFTQIGTQRHYGTDGGGNELRSAVFWKRADGTESGNYTVTKDITSGVGGIFYAVLASYSGCFTAGSPIDDDSEVTDTSDPFTMDTITTTGKNRRIVCGFIFDDNNGRGGVNAGPATGWTNRHALASNQGNDGSIFIDDAEQAAAGSPVNDFWGSTLITEAGVHAFALKPNPA